MNSKFSKFKMDIHYERKFVTLKKQYVLLKAASFTASSYRIWLQLRYKGHSDTKVVLGVIACADRHLTSEYKKRVLITFCCSSVCMCPFILFFISFEITFSCLKRAEINRACQTRLGEGAVAGQMGRHRPRIHHQVIKQDG